MYKIKRFSFKTANQLGLLDGRVKFMHVTQSKNIPSIYEKGLLGSKAHDPDNITNKSRVPKDDQMRDLVYLARNKSVADRMKGAIEGRLGPASILKVSIPYSDYKKMKISDNPEFMKAKNFEDWIKKLESIKNSKIKNEDIPAYKSYWDSYHEGTEVIEGDIDSKYIIGSSSYKKNSIGQTARYIASNPGRFGRGLLEIIKRDKRG